MSRAMKALIWALLMAELLAAPALAQVTAEGTVVYGSAITETASAGGTVAEVCVQAGARIHAGDRVATLDVTPVYAPCDGTVEIIFAGEGEDAESATAKYGGALTIVPENRYMIYASAEYAYESARTSRIMAGQIVYMKCTADGTHRGTGVITEIDGDVFTIESTAGAYYNGETVYVYMEPDYNNVDKLGKGTVVATAVQAVAGSGDVAALYVDEGDFVEKGQLLFETLGALPDDAACEDPLALVCGTDGFITSVNVETGAEIEKGAPLISVCPAAALEVSIQLAESDIASAQVGSPAELRFELPEETVALAGSIASIAWLPSEADEDGVYYEARVTFEGDAWIRPGMTATVTIDQVD